MHELVELLKMRILHLQTEMQTLSATLSMDEWQRSVFFNCVVDVNELVNLAYALERALPPEN